MGRFRLLTPRADLSGSFVVSGVPAEATASDRPSTVRSAPAGSAGLDEGSTACSVELDAPGRPLAGAHVIAVCGAFQREASMRDNGSFSLSSSPLSALVRVLGSLKECRRIQEVDGCILRNEGHDDLRAGGAHCLARLWGRPGPRRAPPQVAAETVEVIRR